MFGKRKRKAQGSTDDKKLTLEDLITLERYDEAERMLKERLKYQPKDLHAHLKLAEVYVALRNVSKAVDAYVFVADSLASDGFHDKGLALLQKAAKIVPTDDTIPRRIEKFRTLKKLEQRREYAIAGLLENASTGAKTAGNSKLEVELLWNKIARSHLVRELDGERVRKLFSVMVLQKLEQDAVLVEAGSSTRRLVLIVEGVIEASMHIGGRNYELRSFSTGDLIGESVLLERKPWPANYKVLERATVFTLDKTGLATAMVGHEDPRAFLDVLRRQHNDRDVAGAIARLER